MQQRDLITCLHIGLPHEPVGVMVLDRQEKLTGKFDESERRWTTDVRYAVQHIGRLASAARYGEVVQAVSDAIDSREADRAAFLVNITTSGRAMLSMLHHRRPTPVLVTGDSGLPKIAGRAINVPLKDLVGTLTMIIGERRMSAAPDMPNADELAKQLQQFRTVKPKAGPLAELRPEEPSELAMATMIAVWWGERMLRSLVPQPKAPPLPIEVRPPTFDEAVKAATRRD